MATFSSLFLSCQIIAAFISLVTLAATGTELTSYNTFMILSLVSTLRTTVSWNIAQAVNLLADFAAALNRIQGVLEFENGNIHKYLEDTFAKSGNNKLSEDEVLKDDRFPCFDAITETAIQSPDRDPAILLKNVVCSWIGSWNKLTLKYLCLSAEKGDLVFITGPVGCGKSSLLNAILGEMPLFNGEISCRGKIAWVGQQPWVFSGTVRENILFGEAFEPQRYRMTLLACDLYKDLERFPDGDITRVGERGIVLSGGQRARVELARAVYSNADIYLLDDPLSAVDTKVGHHIFETCISELLHDKTRLMTTHNIQALRDAKNILVMKDGSIIPKGNFTSLLQSGTDFSSMDKCIGKKQDITLPKETPMLEDQSTSETIRFDETFASLENVEEDRVVGSISWKLYWHYIQSGMCAFLTGVVVIFVILVQGWLLCCSF